MPATVKLIITRGPLDGQEFVFTDRTTCILGRADDCSPSLPDDAHHRTISRHHCLLDLNPPDIRIRDFGSLNGTFVNGTRIGRREPGMTPEQGAQMKFPERDLNDGDQIELGDTLFRVRIFVPARCAGCSAEIAENQKQSAEQSPGVYRCALCRDKARATPSPAPLPDQRVCAHCGQDVATEIGPNRQGEFVCAGCRSEPARIVQDFLVQPSVMNEDLLAIQEYRIERPLGQGGMGAVFLARHTHTGEQVALKVMLPQVAAAERSKELFLREAENTKALRHSNVVRLLRSGCSQGTFFLTLEYCDGGSVVDLMKHNGGSLPLEDALAITRQVLDGLEYAHNVFGPGDGIIHRDLKPANILLCGSGRDRIAKVADYGLGKAFDLAGLSGQTSTGSQAGTPSFQPRQQVIDFKYAKPEVDVWAAAASLYFMLTCAPPRDFPEGKDPWLVLLQTSAVPILRRNASLPPRLAKVIDEALIDKPRLTFKSATELKQTLEDALR
jgi:serine/threonine-protein kinase